MRRSSRRRKPPRPARFIEQLPLGFDEVVGERGYTLSGGQRQRIVIARVLLTDPAVLVLDDATSAIDVVVEEQIHHALKARLGHRTTILIAHRLSTIALADRVVLLDGGRIVASGTHAGCSRPSLVMPRCWRPNPTDRTTTDGHVRRPPRRLRWPQRRSRPTRPPASPHAGVPGDLAVRIDEVLEREPVHAAPSIVFSPVHYDRRPFTLRTFLGPHRWALVGAFLLVVVETLSLQAGPMLTQLGIDHGIARS